MHDLLALGGPKGSQSIEGMALPSTLAELVGMHYVLEGSRL